MSERLITVRLARDGIQVAWTTHLADADSGYQAVTAYRSADGSLYEARVEIQPKPAREDT